MSVMMEKPLSAVPLGVYKPMPAIGAKKWKNKSVRGMNLAEQVKMKCDDHNVRAKALDTFAGLREECILKSNTTVHQYCSEVRTVVTFLRRSFADTNEEIKYLTNCKSEVEKHLEHIRKDVKLNQNSKEMRSNRPKREMVGDGADKLLAAERKKLLQIKKEAEHVLKSAKDGLEQLRVARDNLSAQLSERTRVMDLMCHSYSVRPSSTAGALYGDLPKLNAKPLGPYTPQSGNIMYSNTSLLFPPDTTLAISSYEAIFLSVYSTFAVITGTLGNLLVIIATGTYRSFNVDIVTVQFIRHLALADLVYVLSSVLPWVVTSFYRKWILGDTACSTLGVFYMLCVTANIGFLVFVSAHRLGRCLAPMQLSWLNPKRVKSVIIGVWVVSAIVPSVMTYQSVKGNNPIGFQPTVTFCVSTGLVDLNQGSFLKSFYLIFVMLMCMIMILLNIAILIKAVFSTRRLSKVAIRTVCSICLVFMINWSIPFYRTTVELHPGNNKQADLATFRVGRYMFTLATISNPFLYTMTNVKFKMFVFKQIRRVLCIEVKPEIKRSVV